MKKTILIIVSTIYCFSTTVGQIVATLQPDGITGKDALLHGLSSEVNNNYGGNTQLAATAWTFNGVPGVVRSLIEFNLTSIPINSIIDSAKLSLYAIDYSTGLGQHSTLSGSNDCWLERVTSSWNESTVTWNTQPTITTQGIVSLPASTSATQDYLNINVTAIVQDMVTNPSTNFGFMLKLQNENYYRNMNFCSSDHTNPALRPKLTIFYQVHKEVPEQYGTNNFISLYPNPFSNAVAIQMETELINGELTVYNSFGQMVKQIKNISGQSIILNRDNLPSGLYFIRLTRDDKIISAERLMIID
jgi:hypothetical protein